ncbi:deoxyribodipyrimidine photolyase [Gluconobacter oxydans]|uniref:cryptochrome/photolyase family protein n=1 Tax=Gluconobacter thailandicus TaxID=257438 RepID=UPI0002997308|nr:cryptochrome/photolyase family protein [Gluconobacter thailandicus]AFW01822.1 deoxyribodipyrimidine photolyase-related protein [Gluconobacter oxydans H24]ANQ42584.1 deoxyribodipyrimidine photolyase [Gluconobacter oxydans]
MMMLIPVLGDQLSPSLASLQHVDRSKAVVLLMEVWDEATYVRHHKKKIAFIFSAMRHFAEELRADGWSLDYVTLDDPENTQSFTGEVERAARKYRATSIRTVSGAEYRVFQAQKTWSDNIGIPCDVLEDDRFICSLEDFKQWAKSRKTLRMEYFYRDMRQKTGLLMHPDDTPVGGQWNFDHDNREKPPSGLNYPSPERFEPDAVTKNVLNLVRTRFGDHFGDLEPFSLPVTRQQALKALEAFIDISLPDFGRFQDAMMTGQDYLYHSSLSLCINTGLLTPLEVCEAAATAYENGDAPINSVEGFIRQIIGWREYMRGMYWQDMPEFASRNALAAKRPLPNFFWTGKTEMNCLAQSIDQTKREAYAHHIQRLMVLGNFALLAGINPQEISDWFLVVYFDAFEWVELPNVIGMSQFADGGKIASKPYVGSGAYINRMSDYCGKCHFDVKQKTGAKACPFNALYWDFLARHETRFSRNMRMKNMYATWHRFTEDKRHDYRASASEFLKTLTSASPGWARKS